jgi:hypothetical protein
VTSKTATYGTAAANATTTRSLSAGSVTSVSRTRVVVRPEVSVPAPAARALRDQSEVPIPA